MACLGNTRFVIHRSMSPDPFSPQPDPAAQPSPTRVLLLVEDNPGDAQLVNELLMDFAQHLLGMVLVVLVLR